MSFPTPLSTTLSRVVSTNNTDLPTGHSPGNYDVCFGYGNPFQDNPGNIFFKTLLQSSLESYQQASTQRLKTAIIKNIMDRVHAHGGNFLKQDGCGQWRQLTPSQVRHKVSQALRDQQVGQQQPIDADAMDLKCATLQQEAPPPLVLASSTTSSCDLQEAEPPHVFCGRGRKFWSAPGNMFFRSLVQGHALAYQQAKENPIRKESLVVAVRQSIEERGGRFLKQQSDGQWEDLGPAATRKKISHSLRDQGVLMVQKAEEQEQEPVVVVEAVPSSSTPLLQREATCSLFDESLASAPCGHLHHHTPDSIDTFALSTADKMMHSRMSSRFSSSMWEDSRRSSVSTCSDMSLVWASRCSISEAGSTHGRFV